MSNNQPILQNPLTPQQILRWRRLLFRYQAIRAARTIIEIYTTTDDSRHIEVHIEPWIWQALVDHVEQDWFQHEPDMEHVSADGFPYYPDRTEF